MRELRPSRTALYTAFLRALHLHVDDAPPLLNDTLAFKLLPGYQQRLILRLAAVPAPWRLRLRPGLETLTGLRTQVVLRARYAEDALAAARTAGIARYVVLAAGLDTFAWRQSAPMVSMVEIDHPATQSWKRALVARQGIAEPAGVDYLAVDFEREALAGVWPVRAAPDFISWLGVSYYLSREAILDTLSGIAERAAPGSQLVLDYWCQPPAFAAGAGLLWRTRAMVALQREPLRSLFTSAEIEAVALQAGWRVREHCAPAEQERRYLAGRADRLAVPAFAWLLHLER